MREIERDTGYFALLKILMETTNPFSSATFILSFYSQAQNYSSPWQNFDLKLLYKCK